MQTASIEQNIVFSAEPSQVYHAIMDSAVHSAFTQSECIIGNKVGDSYTAYDGYIEGTILELIPDQYIKKTWMAWEDGWPEGHYSEVEFHFKTGKGGTEMRFVHTGIPALKVESFRKGWIDNYWEPMEAMFLRGKK